MLAGAVPSCSVPPHYQGLRIGGKQPNGEPRGETGRRYRTVAVKFGLERNRSDIHSDPRECAHRCYSARDANVDFEPMNIIPKSAISIIVLIAAIVALRAEARDTDWWGRKLPDIPNSRSSSATVR